jgi:hypothetical protein
MLQEERFCQERRDEVARHEFAVTVDEEAAVRVAVPRDADVRLLPDHRRGDVTPVVLDERIRLMVRKRPVDGEAEARRPAGELVEQRRCHEAAHTAAGVEHDVERLDDRRVDEGQHLLDVLRQDVVGPHRARRRRRRRQPVGGDHVADVADAGIAAERGGAFPDHLDAVVLLRVVRGGDLRAALEVVLDDRVIQHVGAEHAVVDHVRPLLARALDERRGQCGRRRAHVTRDADLRCVQVCDESAPDLPRHLLVDLVGVQAADVVGLEDAGIDVHVLV